MSTTQIGVHLADHSFFPVFDGETAGRKRLTLTTSHPDQSCVDIVLYRRDSSFPQGEERLGHILLCDIEAPSPDQSEIELALTLDENGHIDATAVDRRSGNQRQVSIDSSEAVPEYDETDTYAAGGVQSLLEEERPERSARRRGLPLIAAVFVLIAVLAAALWWFVLAPRSGADTIPVAEPPGATDSEPVDESAEADAVTGTGAASPGADEGAPQEAADEATPPATEDAPPTTEDAPPQDIAQAADSPATPQDAAPPADSPATPQEYQIKWGDTLWDISRMFYGTPWRFREIAEENRIVDPDRIYASDEITIPWDSSDN